MPGGTRARKPSRDLGVVVVVAELEPMLGGGGRRGLESAGQLRVAEARRVDPADDEATPAEHVGLLRERRQPGLDRLELRVAAARDEPALVEPAADVLGPLPVQAEELDALVAHGRDLAQRATEVALALAAHGVEHQADARHPSERTRCPARRFPCERIAA